LDNSHVRSELLPDPVEALRGVRIGSVDAFTAATDRIWAWRQVLSVTTSRKIALCLSTFDVNDFSYVRGIRAVRRAPCAVGRQRPAEAVIFAHRTCSVVPRWQVQQIHRKIMQRIMQNSSVDVVLERTADVAARLHVHVGLES
jgi:hypothetical protein